MSQMTPILAGKAELRELADELRPELHRYCSRLTGSIIDGEDVVQDTFERAFAALDEIQHLPSLRPWLFKIAHNRAFDLLRSRAVRAAEPLEAAADVADTQTLDPAEGLLRKEAVRIAISRFVELPVTQRSVLVLKDVLDQSLQEIAAMLNLSVDAVKAHLARGRARLKQIQAEPFAQTPPKGHSKALERYADLFNRRDWNALRSMLADDVRLVQSAHPQRIGAGEVSMFFGIYSRSEPVRLLPAWLEGREVLAVFDKPDMEKPAYFMWLEWDDGRISFIRDYRHLSYIMDDAQLVFG